MKKLKFDKKKENILIAVALCALAIFVVYRLKSRKKDGESKNDIPKKSLDPKVEDAKLSEDFNFYLLPDGLNNYRSAQFQAKDLPGIIKKYGIKRIIRLNGDSSSDQKHKSSYTPISISQEKKVCEDNNCEFFNISSHDGYKEGAGQGYVKSVDKVVPIFEKGNTLLHCAHGADRTGAMIGGYLKRNKHMTDLDTLWKYTTEKNGWQSKIDKNGLKECKKCFFGSGYDKYADTFYPLDLLKKSKWVKK